ncbi:hypothetical protein BaRGS_00023575 [Batillaria attramentaria]|uniref:Secreted protein n=1 Tax=Batillaria attramentaria TaxID=370345 RepID=A0ABD0KDY4_9CAEN
MYEAPEARPMWLSIILSIAHVRLHGVSHYRSITTSSRFVNVCIVQRSSSGRIAGVRLSCFAWIEVTNGNGSQQRRRKEGTSLFRAESGPHATCVVLVVNCAARTNSL